MIALALAAAVLAVQARVVVGTSTWDDPRFHADVAPPRLAAADAVQHGAWPGWWDGSSLGVPLAAEPSHGATSPLMWLATSPHALELVLVAHLWWAALGVALWARRRGASVRAAAIAGVLAAATGIAASAALRGALPALAQLPWVGWAACGLAERRRDAALLAVFVGAIAVAGELAVVVDAVVLAIAVGARRDTWRWLVAALAAGLAVGGALWIPAAYELASTAGARVEAIPFARWLELVAPAHGSDAWPSVFVGAPLLVLGALPSREDRVRAGARVACTCAYTLLALVAGRGGWPAWLGAPELHVGALALVIAGSAAHGLDALAAGERRARLAIAVTAALAALAFVRGDVVDGAVGVACLAAAAALASRAHGWLALALVVAPGVVAQRVVAPVVSADVLDEPEWARAASALPEPRRLYRPPQLFDLDSAPLRGAARPGTAGAFDLDSAPHRGAARPGTAGAFEHPSITLADALATLAGASPARWGVAAARSDDPARSPAHDATWFAAGHEGDALLDRFGISLAILPASRTERARPGELARAGTWSLVRVPAAPPAAVYSDWEFVADVPAAIARAFPSVGARGGRERVVLVGQGVANEEGLALPRPCTIERWDAGAIDLACSTQLPAYAVVSSSAAPGWTATVDDRDAPWLVADALRRAVALPPGAHHVAWRYAAPGRTGGLALAAAGVLGIAALFALARRHSPAQT